MVKFSRGGLLDNNIYLNNVAKKTGNPLLDGTIDMNIPQIKPSSDYNSAVAKNNTVMNAINNPTPNNVMTRANAYNQNMDIEYPPEVLAEPKRKNMLEEYLFGSDGYQPSVEEKKMVYRATKNLTDMERTFFETNPEKFFDYYHKVGDYKPDETQLAGGQDAVAYSDLSTLGRNNMDFMGMANPNSTYAKMMIEQGANPKEFDPQATVHGTTPEDRTEGGQTYSYAQWNSLKIQKNSSTMAGVIENEKVRGGQGWKTISTPTYNDDGTVDWSEPMGVTLLEPDLNLDTAFNKEVRLKWAVQGGMQTEQANIQNFNEVIRILDNPNATSSGLLYEVTPEKITKITEAINYEPEKDKNGNTFQVNNVLDLVRAVVFQSLKKTLGGQFTEKEAQRLVEATFNPSLSPQQNIKRIIALREKMISIFRSQQRAIEYYNKNNTLYGYDTTVGSVDIADLKNMSITDLTDQIVQEQYNDNRDFYENMSVEEANIHWDSAGELERAFMKTIFE